MQLERGQFDVAGRPVGISPGGYCDRESARLASGQIGQERGDIDVVGGVVGQAFHRRVGSLGR